MKRPVKRLLWLIAVGAVLFLITRFAVKPFVVVGESMTPTLRSWDLCLMQRVYHYQPIRGDIIVFRTADDPPLYFVKRVVALPGETMAIESGVVNINGVRLREPYTTTNPDWQMDPTLIPQGKVFVIGDNRTVDFDIAFHELIATRLVQARMLWHWRWKR